MKTVAVILGLAFVLISAVMISLVGRGGALKPAGVIKPAEIGPDLDKIGKQIATRLYPELHAAKYVIWRLGDGAEALDEIPRLTFMHYQAPNHPTVQDLRHVSADCLENCWYIQSATQALPDAIARVVETEPTIEIYLHYFDRDESVSEVCENEKILSVKCLKPVSVREVRRKIKTSAPHFFMQRYQDSQFHLFVEKKN